MVFVILNTTSKIEAVYHELKLAITHLHQNPSHSVQIWNKNGKHVGGFLSW